MYYRSVCVHSDNPDQANCLKRRRKQKISDITMIMTTDPASLANDNNNSNKDNSSSSTSSNSNKR